MAEMEEIVELANFLYDLDDGTHTIPYEAWAEQILGKIHPLPPLKLIGEIFSEIEGRSRTIDWEDDMGVWRELKETEWQYIKVKYLESKPS